MECHKGFFFTGEMANKNKNPVWLDLFFGGNHDPIGSMNGMKVYYIIYYIHEWLNLMVNLGKFTSPIWVIGMETSPKAMRTIRNFKTTKNGCQWLWAKWFGQIAVAQDLLSRWPNFLGVVVRNWHKNGTPTLVLIIRKKGPCNGPKNQF